MKYKTYDQLVTMVRKLRTNLSELNREEQDKIVRRTFKIDQATIREIDGTTDLINFGRRS
jgi:hypothetical protein